YQGSPLIAHLLREGQALREQGRGPGQVALPAGTDPQKIERARDGRTIPQFAAPCQVLLAQRFSPHKVALGDGQVNGFVEDLRSQAGMAAQAVRQRLLQEAASLTKVPSDLPVAAHSASQTERYLQARLIPVCFKCPLHGRP